MPFETFTADLFRARETEFLSIAADIPSDYWAREHFLAELPEKWRLSFALLEEDMAVGYAIMSRPEQNCVHLHHFMLRASHRGGGRGGLMIDECLHRAIVAGAQYLSLKIAANSLRAQRFYVRHGFVEARREENYLRLERPLF